MKDSLAEIECKFNGDTNKGDGASQCSAYFTEATIESFGGDGATCQWQTNSLLMARMMNSATMLPGGNVTLRGGRIRRSTIGCQETMQETTMSLIAPDNPPLVSAQITGLESVQACSPIELDSASSSGGGGRPMLRRWFIIGLEGVQGTSQEDIDALSEAVASQTGVGLTVDSSRVNGNPLRLTFGLEMTNFLGISSVANRTVTRADTPVPPVILTDSSLRRVRSTDAVTIGTSLQKIPSQCPTPVPSTVVYNWKASDESVISSGGGGKGFVYIAPRKLRSGRRYDFYVASRYEGETASSGLNVTVEVEPEPPVAIIRKCNRAVEFGGSAVYEVDATPSFSPDSTNVSSRALSFRWNCQRSFADEFGVNSCDFPDAVNLDSPILTLDSSFMADTSDIASIGGHNYYLLSVTVTDADFGISSTQTCRLWTQTVGTPEASIEQWIEFTRISPAAGTITLVSNSTLNATEVTASTYQWICQYRDGEPCDLDLGSSKVVKTQPNNPILVLAGGAIPESVSHTFTLTVITPGGATGIASSEVILSPGPSPGSCSVSPQQGYAYNTSFTFRCESWTGGTRILYAYLDSNLGILREAISNPSFTTTLPGKGTPGIDPVEMSVRVTNDEGGTTLYPITVMVETPELSNDVANELANSQADNALQLAESGDITAASSAVENAKALLDTSSSTSSDDDGGGGDDDAESEAQQREIETKMLQAVETLVSTAPQTTQSIVQKARLFSIITEPAPSRPEPSLQVANATVRLLGSLITSLSEDPDLDYTEEFGNQTVRAIGNVLNTTATSGPELSTGVDDSINQLGNTIGAFVSPGQQPLTISQPGLDLSVQKYDLENTFLNQGSGGGEGSGGEGGGSGGDGGGDEDSPPVTGGEIPPPKVPSLQLGHNTDDAADGETKDAAQVPISALLGAAKNPLAVFSSAKSFWPRSQGNTPQTDLVNIAFYDDSGEEIKVTGVENNGIKILLTGARLETVDEETLNLTELTGNRTGKFTVTTEIVDVCQFWNATTRTWSSDGCVGTLDAQTRTFLCECSHLTSFQGAQEAQPKFNSISVRDIQNLTLENLSKNFVTLAALIFVFAVYFIVSFGARYSKKQAGLRVCCQGACLCCGEEKVNEKREKIFREYQQAEEIDFMLQWYFQLHYEPPHEDEEAKNGDGQLMRSGKVGQSRHQQKKGVGSYHYYRRGRAKDDGSYHKANNRSGFQQQSNLQESSTMAIAAGHQHVTNDGGNGGESLAENTTSMAMAVPHPRNRPHHKLVRAGSSLKQLSGSKAKRYSFFRRRARRRKGGADVFGSQDVKNMSSVLGQPALSSAPSPRVGGAAAVQHGDDGRSPEEGAVNGIKAMGVVSIHNKAQGNGNDTKQQHPTANEDHYDDDDSYEKEGAATGCGRRLKSCLTCCRTHIFCWCCPVPKDPNRVKTAEELQEEKKQRLLRVMKRALLHGGERVGLLREVTTGKVQKKQEYKEHPLARVGRIWWHMTKMQHVWLSVFLYHRAKPFAAQWRANVLLQTLLLVMLASGFFYGQNQSAMGEWVVGIISAMIVSVLTIILVILAKKIGLLEWELNACEVRDRLCELLEPEKPAEGEKSNPKDGTSETNPDTKRSVENVSETEDSECLYPSQSGIVSSSKVDKKEKSKRHIRKSSRGSRSTFSFLERFRRGKNGADVENKSSKDDEEDEEEDRISEKGIQGVGSDTQKVARTVCLYRVIAWTFFGIIVSGSAFTILILGVKFDLDDENDGGADFWNTRSFKWLTSVVIAEVFGSVIFDPVATMVKAILLALCISSALSPILVDWLIDDDDLTAVNAYDVFLRVVTGFKLKPESAERLRDLLRRTKKNKKLEESEVTDLEEGESSDEFADMNLESVAAPIVTYIPPPLETKGPQSQPGLTSQMGTTTQDLKTRANGSSKEGTSGTMIFDSATSRGEDGTSQERKRRGTVYEPEEEMEAQEAKGNADNVDQGSIVAMGVVEPINVRASTVLDPNKEDGLITPPAELAAEVTSDPEVTEMDKIIATPSILWKNMNPGQNTSPLTSLEEFKRRTKPVDFDPDQLHLDDVLHSRHGPPLDLNTFGLFCELERNGENLEFYLLIDAFKNHRPCGRAYQLIAQAIFDKYIRSGASKQINISHRALRKAKTAFDSGMKKAMDQKISTGEKEEDYALFDVPQNEVARMLSRDVLHRFKGITIDAKSKKDKKEALKLFGKSLIETKTDGQGKVQVTIFDAEKNNSGFDDLPALHGKARMRRTGSSASRSFSACYVAVVRLHYPDVRAFLVFAKNRRLVEKAVVERSFAGNKDVTILMDIKDIASTSANRKRIQFVASDGDYDGGFEVEIAEGQKSMREFNVSVRDWWVQVLKAYKNRAHQIDRNF